MSQPIDDIRYSELLFLQSFRGGTKYFNAADQHQADQVRLGSLLYVDLACTLLEELYVRLDHQAHQLLVYRLRNELARDYGRSGNDEHSWLNPRDGLRSLLQLRGPQQMQITYRGLRRIEELREVLRHERILDDSQTLLSLRYFERDLEHALQRPPDVEVSVVCLDMDNFRAVNTFGHPAGDVVMKAFLEAVRDVISPIGDAYRGVGDEVKAIVLGLGHDAVSRLAEDIRRRVAQLRCEYDGQELPRVTASIGVATSPPEPRSHNLEDLADQRQLAAKNGGKNQVVS